MSAVGFQFSIYENTVAAIIFFSIAVDCGLLSNPMNGSSSGDSTVFPNSVLFDCDSGFILGGSHERKCLANGSWSGFSTVCSGTY